MLMSWRTWSYFSSIANAKSSSPVGLQGENWAGRPAILRDPRDTSARYANENEEDCEIPDVG
jgi:hypothetical protein